VDEDQFQPADHGPSAASGRLPDVVARVPLAAVRSLAATELLDTGGRGTRGG
jgi:hypothetical protein